jgi:hypothetical protein
MKDVILPSGRPFAWEERRQMNDFAEEIRPAKKWYFVAGALLLLGILCIAWAQHQLDRFYSEGVDLDVPGKKTVLLQVPGDYTIASAKRKDQIPDDLPAGISVTVVRKETGEEIPVRFHPEGGLGDGEPKTYSSAEFSIREPGHYVIQVSNVEEPAKLIVALLPSSTLMIGFWLFGQITFAAGVVTIFVVRYKRRKAFRALSHPQLPPESAHLVRPGRGWYLISVVLFLLGAGGLAAALLDVVSFYSKAERFDVPGRHTVLLHEPGKYFIWKAGQGKYAKDTLPSGVTIRVIDEKTRQEIPVEFSASADQEFGEAKKYSRAGLTIKSAGSYVIEVRDVAEKQTFAISRFPWQTILLWWGACAVSWISLAISAFIIHRKRSRARAALAAAGSA